MQKTLLLLIAVLCLVSCQPEEENATATDTKSGMPDKARQLYALKKDFKYHNLKVFSIDTFNWENRPGNYKELDSNTFQLIWQNEEHRPIDNYYDRDYLYSWQERDTNFIELTILSQTEGSYCDIIYYLIYNKKGELIENFQISASCGDGGWIFQSYGSFINKQTFEYLSIETNMSGFDSLDHNIELQEGDSILTHYVINTNGKVASKEISKTHFIEKSKITTSIE